MTGHDVIQGESGMKRLSDWLLGKSKLPVVIVALVIFLFFVFLVLPAQPKIGVTEDSDPGYPDLAFWYSADHLYGIAEAYGVEGRGQYVRMRYRFDIVWPLVYVGFLATSLSWLYGKIQVTSKLYRINLLPIFAGFFDLMENLLVSVVFLSYPGASPGLPFLAALMTMLKWSLIALSFMCLVGGLAIFIIRLIRSHSETR